MGVIKLLADHIANQIAAGEVVQRPASVVKELMENSIDAGATSIKLIAKDGGKTLIQVIDNGSGMSEEDAKMSFERHATSKIATADDLFKLHTKGFRGEALASVAAIAHVTMKTRLHDEELGRELINEGSEIASCEACSASAGTSIAVKNLFYNVPARRNFLGKNTTEYRKVLDEFLRIALVHPEIEMSFHHDDNEIYNLPSQGLRARIVQVFGKAYNQRLVPVNEETDIVKITGFITKPEFAKSSRDQQFMFVNNRFFKDRYFHHSIMAAYEGLIPSGKFPAYFLYYEVPTEQLDVNVHPTKTEVKFEESQAMYAIIRSAIKQALGQYNVSPTLDFERETSFDVPSLKKGEAVKIPQIEVDPNFNPFHSTEKKKSASTGTSGAVRANGFSQIKPQKEDWEDTGGLQMDREDSLMNQDDGEEVQVERKKPFQVNDKYIMTSVKNGFLLIDQYRAHCRILFDQFRLQEEKVKSQALLFPETLIVEGTDLPWWEEALPHLEQMGFDLSLENKEITITSAPADTGDKNVPKMLKDLFEGFKESEQETDLDFKDRMALSLASSLAVRGGTRLTTEEMQYFIDALFACESPQISPHGKKVIETFTLDEIKQRFE